MPIPLSAIRANPDNPRIIHDDKFNKLVASLRTFPKMLSKRPMVCDNETDGVMLGGNMRLRGIEFIVKNPDESEDPVWATVRKNKAVPADWVSYASDFTEEEKREFLIKDNVGFGAWDWDALANEWDETELNDWGLDVPGVDFGVEMDGETLGTDFTLPDGDKAPFQQMTFTLADEQATAIKNAIDDIKKTEEYKYAETMGNENSNGNALYLIVATWVAQRTY